MTVTVTDNEQPVITCPADITQTADPGVCEAAVTVPSIANSDNCAVASIVNDYNNTADASDVYPVGTTTVVWTVTDIHGNVSTCSMTVTVTDNEQPVITCPADITQTADPGVCEAAVNVPSIANSDNCAVASIVNDYNNTADASDVYPVGTTTVVWTVTDIHGNVSTCSMTVTVTDDELPEITCPGEIQQSTDLDVCEATVIMDLPIVGDNCTIASIVNDYNGTDNGSDIYPVGLTTVIWTVTDANGNSSSCSVDVIIVDDQPLDITCPEDITQSADAGVCEAFVVVPAPINLDNCGIGTITNSYNGTDDATDTYPVGTTTVTWTVTDLHNNISTCVMNITVTDDEEPAITCSADITHTTDENLCEAFVTVDAPTVLDNCGVASVINNYNNTSDASGTYPEGTTSLVWIVTDIHGNETSCTMNITVNDVQNPSIICPDNVEANTAPGVCESFVNVPVPVIADNCGIQSVINNYNNSGSANDIYPQGTTEVIWTVTDVNGNTNSCSMNVIVNDIEFPEIQCGNDVAADNEPGLCTADVIVPGPVVSDNCGILSITNDFTFSSNADGTYPGGVTTVTWFVTDLTGNVTTCEQSVTVFDVEPPVALNCGFTITVENDPGECGAIVEYQIPEVTDNCGIPQATIVAGLESGEFFPLGQTTVEYLYTDINDNTVTCSFIVEVIDTEDPSVNCPTDIVTVNDPGICGAMVMYSVPSFTDNCGTVDGTVELVSGLAPGEVFPVGTTVVSYQITDSNGNTFPCSFNVTVNDVEAPDIICPEDIIQQDPIVVYVIPQAVDNCEVDSIYVTTGLESGEVFPHGYTDVELVAVDIAGNTDTCAFNVLVNNPPTALPDVAEVTEENEIINISILFNDFDIDGDSISVTGVWGGNGSVTLNDDGTITYIIDTEVWCGVDSIFYSLCDEYNACDTSVVIIDVECFLGIEIPEGFSPNGDGINDLFEILGLEDYPNNKLAIFNRWGHKVYEAESYANDWDGRSQSPLTIGDGMLPKGTYYYVFDPGDGEKEIKGYFFLNR
jgi:gliding motility-associated-like protein